MMRVLTWLAVGLICACADGELSGDRSTGGGVVDDQHEVRYVDRTAFDDGIARVVPSRAFASIGLTISVADGVAVELRTLDADGAGGEFVAIEPDAVEPGSQTATMRLDAPAHGLELRASVPPSFVRIELSTDAVLLGDVEDEGEGEHEHEGGEVIYRAAPGMWQPSGATLAAGNDQYLPYVGASGCWAGRRLRDGTRELADFLVATFPGARSYGGYNCRRIAGTSTWSVHSTGRAIDLFVPVDGGAADNGKGDPIAAWLVENAEYVGISLIIWDRASWGAHRSRGGKHRSYSGAHPHHDHLHIELTESASGRGSAWFRDGKPVLGGGGGGACRVPSLQCSFEGWLAAGTSLARGQSTTSCDGRFQLVMQHDGNLVLYQARAGAVWSSGTHGTAADVAVMQTDGNLVVYAPGGRALWASGTHGNPGAFAYVGNDGTLAVLGAGFRRLWSSGSRPQPEAGCGEAWMPSGSTLGPGNSATSCDGRYHLVMQDDGNLVLYQRAVGAVWATGTNGSGANAAVMQGDGNLVVYASGRPVWDSGTHGHAGAALAVQSDGNVVIYGSGRALWSSATNECR